MKSVMMHQFSQVPKVSIPRSRFDRSHGRKLTFDAGYLVPILCDEILPGDSFNVNMTALVRMSTPLYPIMDNLYLDTHFFFVPNRLVWDNWQKFMGEQENPGDSTDYLVPQRIIGQVTEGSTEDYFGLPLVSNVKANALPFRAYHLIFNEWYRDQNLKVAAPVEKGDSDDETYTLKRRQKRHDYFTSCLPWPQKGESVQLPLGGNVPVIGIGVDQGSDFTSPNKSIAETGGVFRTYDFAAPAYDNGSPDIWVGQDTAYPGYPGIYADLSESTAATINQLRQAFQVQRMLERDARGGTRYTELVRSHFGVTSPDARLQRPEYLGGGSTPINISQVLSQAQASSAERGLGDTGAYSVTPVRGHGFSKSFTEHGYIIGIASVRADLTYQQGLNRMWSRQTRYDFYWPSLAHLGEQAVLNGEIYYQGTDEDNNVFGYQERSAEYRYKPSEICGAFRSKAAQPLDAWHLSQEFTTLPALNASFIAEQPPMSRVLQFTDEPHFIADLHFSMKCARPMPLYGVPGLIDHF